MDRYVVIAWRNSTKYPLIEGFMGRAKAEERAKALWYMNTTIMTEAEYRKWLAEAREARPVSH